MPRQVIPWQYMLASFLGAVLLAACAHPASGDPGGAQGLVVDRSFENAEVGSLGETRVSGENVTPQGSNATLKYFKSVDAGKTWGELQDTGMTVNAVCVNPSFARYGDNYYVFETDDTSAPAYYSTDGENWRKDSKVPCHRFFEGNEHVTSVQRLTDWPTKCVPVAWCCGQAAIQLVGEALWDR